MSESFNPEIAIRLPVEPAAVAERTGSPLESAVVALFGELHHRLLRYVLSFGLTVADGEEIIQEAFLALVKHIQQGRSQQNLRGWLFRVAHNQSLKRKAGNERRCDAAGDNTRDAEIQPDPSLNPEEQASFNQRQTRLLAAMEALSPQDQSCLRLRAEGLRYREISDVLGISLGSVAASLGRSLERLGRVYER